MISSLSQVNQKFVLPVKRFLREEVHSLDTERKTLATRRLAIWTTR